MQQPNHGFSLVELSIVLVILGLLTGGILGGQALIRASELRSITTERDQFVTAVNTFKQKYFTIPGDMLNATQFWGRADNGTFTGQCAAPNTNTGTGKQTCNGNGDGWVNLNGANANESFRFWQHLSNAGLLTGTFTGVTGPGGTVHAVPGSNVPRAKIGNAAWMTAGFPNYAGAGTVFQSDYGHYFYIGAPTTNTNPNLPLLSTEEAWNIDTKTDDGKPALGKVVVAPSNTCTDASGVTDIDADYALSATGILCTLYITKAF